MGERAAGRFEAPEKSLREESGNACMTPFHLAFPVRNLDGTRPSLATSSAARSTLPTRELSDNALEFTGFASRDQIFAR
jgi:extradiol dioxygenase family protein